MPTRTMLTTRMRTVQHDNQMARDEGVPGTMTRTRTRMQQPEERGRTWDEDEDARTIRRIRFGCTRTRDGTHNNQIMNEGQGRGLLKVAGGTTWETEMDQFSKDMAVALGAADGMGRLF